MISARIEQGAVDGAAALLTSEIAALSQRLAAARQTAKSASLRLVGFYAETRRAAEVSPVATGLEDRLRASGLFDPQVYLSLNPDLAADVDSAWSHFLQSGFREGRPFTSPETVARLLVELDAALDAERYSLTRLAESRFAAGDEIDHVSPLRRPGTKVGVFCSSLGNFFMREIADLLAWGLQAEGIDTAQRDETASREEPFCELTGRRVIAAI